MNIHFEVCQKLNWAVIELLVFFETNVKWALDDKNSENMHEELNSYW